MAPVLPYASDAAADAIDRSFHAALARLTGGVSPAALAMAFADWHLHLLASPGKRAGLVGQAIQNTFQFFDSMVPRHATFQPWSVIRPPENDRHM
jgi:polyhydroxyalkanoate synthase